MAPSDAEGDGYLGPAEARGLLSIDVERFHYTYSISDFRTFREDIRYIYSCNPERFPRVLPLSWREREVQANLIVLADDGRNLVYLPLRQVLELSRNVMREAWKALVQSVIGSGVSLPTDPPESLLKITGFEPTEADKNAALRDLDAYDSGLGKHPSFVRLQRLATRFQHEYIPFVLVPPGVAELPLYFIRQGVDVYTPLQKPPERRTHSEFATEYSYLELVWFLLTGRIKFDVPLPFLPFSSPPWRVTNSIHVRVIIPNGLRIRSALSGKPRISGFPRPLFATAKILQFASWDQENLYAYFNQEGFDKLAERRKTLRESRKPVRNKLLERASRHVKRAEQIQREAKTTVDRIASTWPRDPLRLVLALMRLALVFIALLLTARKAKASANKLLREVGFSKSLSRPLVRIKSGPTAGLGSLLGVLWLVNILAYGAAIVWGFSADVFFGSFAALLTVILTMAVFSIGKQFVRELVAAQILAAASVFVELILLRRLFGG